MKFQIKGMGDKTTYWIDGKQVSRSKFWKMSPPCSVAGTGDSITAWKRPLRSDAMAVNTSQIPAAMERNRKAGITGVSYDPKDGTAIISSRGARRDLMRVMGVHDRNGGYGDDHATTDFVDSSEGVDESVYDDDFR